MSCGFMALIWVAVAVIGIFTNRNDTLIGTAFIISTMYIIANKAGL
jgi:hypothetical protein